MIPEKPPRDRQAPGKDKDCSPTHTWHRLPHPTTGVVVAGLSVHRPRNAQDLIQMLQRGNANRTQHPTDANATSSRSHAVFTIHVHQKPRTADLT
jgi:hypothetical protein